MKKRLVEKNVPTDPSKWSYYKSQAKEKFDVYPCVPLDSLAVTKNGLKTYDELVVGDDILTYNIETGFLEWNPILNLHYFENADLMEIKKATGFRFKCTPNHKWVIKRDEGRKAELVEAKDITTHMRVVFSAALKETSNQLDLLNEDWGKHDTWLEKIIKMNNSQREVWLSSAIVYDGWEKGKSIKINGRRTFGFSQKNRDHLLSTLYAAFLNGYYVSVNDLENDIVSVTIIRGKQTHGSQNIIKTFLDEKEDVWCPETENKTWVMVQNGWFTITGNSAYANAWAAKQYKAAGGGWKTEEGVVNEAKNEPPVITQLRDVIRSGYKSVKDPKTGKQMKVDSYSASAIIAVYDQLKKQENRDQFVNAGLMKMQTVAFKLLNRQEGVIKENNVEDVIKDLDKVKGDLLKKVDVLVAKKKKLYSNVDIESPMSAEEKKLDKDIADLFSQIQQLVLQKRKMKKESVNEGNAFTGALFKARKEGLKEFEFGGKKYPVINEVDDDDEPSVSSVKKAGKGVEKQKREILSIQKKLKDNGKKTAEFVKIPQGDRTPAQKAHLKNMADLTAKLKKLKSLTEDIDVGHQDDEPNMLKADLFRIAKYAKELYELLGQFDNSEEEIDFPHWWQSDIVNAKTLMVNAKHYLNGELNVNGNPLGEVKKNLSEGLKYHIKNQKPISENIYRWGSPKFFKLINECRTLWKRGQFMPMNESDEWFLDSDLGKVDIYEGKKVLLDFPILTEAEYQGKEVELNSPKRNSGEGKKYVVYVKDPQSGNIRKVTFGDVKGGLTAKISNPEARKAFSDRHNCPDKKDKTSPGYWSCNLPRHWSKIGGGEDINSYW